MGLSMYSTLYWKVVHTSTCGHKGRMLTKAIMLIQQKVSKKLFVAYILLSDFEAVVSIKKGFWLTFLRAIRSKPLHEADQTIGDDVKNIGDNTSSPTDCINVCVKYKTGCLTELHPTERILGWF